LKTIKEVRIENLNILVESHGSVQALADAIGKSQAVVSHMRSGKYFGDKSARDIERALSLPIGHLDNDHTSFEQPIDSLLNQIKVLFESNQINTEEVQLLTNFREPSAGTAKSAAL